MDDNQKTSQILLKIQRQKQGYITLGKIIDMLESSGYSVLLVLFAAPLALPLPALGIAQIMAVPILFLSIQLAIGKKSPWLPKKLYKKQLSLEKLSNSLTHAIKFLQKIERFLHPRLSILSSKLGHNLTGIVCVLCAISIAFPIPFSNTIPSFGIVLMSMGLLERDGLVIIAGMIVGAIGISLTIAVVFFGSEFISQVIKGVF